MANFRITVVSSEGIELDAEVTKVSLSTPTGSTSILSRHTPFLTLVALKNVKVYSEFEGQIFILFVDSGFAVVENNRLSIYTKTVEDAGTIDYTAAEEDVSVALEQLNQATTAKEILEAKVCLARAQARLAAAIESQNLNLNLNLNENESESESESEHE